jgi:hypothetical protein
MSSISTQNHHGDVIPAFSSALRNSLRPLSSRVNLKPDSLAVCRLPIQACLTASDVRLLAVDVRDNDRLGSDRI